MVPSMAFEVKACVRVCTFVCVFIYKRTRIITCMEKGKGYAVAVTILLAIIVVVVVAVAKVIGNLHLTDTKMLTDDRH